MIITEQIEILLKPIPTVSVHSLAGSNSLQSFIFSVDEQFSTSTSCTEKLVKLIN